MGQMQPGAIDHIVHWFVMHSFGSLTNAPDYITLSVRFIMPDSRARRLGPRYQGECWEICSFYSLCLCGGRRVLLYILFIYLFIHISSKNRSSSGFSVVPTLNVGRAVTRAFLKNPKTIIPYLSDFIATIPSLYGSWMLEEC